MHLTDKPRLLSDHIPDSFIGQFGQEKMFEGNYKRFYSFACLTRIFCFCLIFTWLALLGVLLFTSRLYLNRTPHSQSLQSNRPITPFFKHSSSTAHLECGRVLANDTAFIKNISRVVQKHEADLNIECDSIYNRHFFPVQPASTEEQHFPIAFSRVVFKDYSQIEMQLAGSYAPQNWYCFSLDSKADEEFKKRVRTLASCFPNIFVGSNEFDMDSKGHNMTYSQLQCMQLLVDKQWEYLVLLQNHDIALKTNQELVQIFQWFGGANDIEMLKTIGYQHYLYSFDLSFEALKLFKNSSKNTIGYNDLPPKLQLAKGFVQSSVSKPMVEFIVNELDLREFVKLIEKGQEWAIDEVYLQSLSTSDALNAPGAFTHDCLDKGIEVYHVSRYSLWSYFNEDKKKCQGQLWRHQLCIFGLEDLAFNLKDSPYLFANKMMTEIDLGAIACWHETLFNRTYLDRGVHRLDATFYKQLPHVRYHVEKKANGTVNKTTFDCKEGNLAGDWLKYYFEPVPGNGYKILINLTCFYFLVFVVFCLF